MQSGTMERALAAILTAAAIVMAVAVSATELRSFKARPERGSAVREPTYLNNWQLLAGKAHLWGDSQAPIQIVEFSDLECPACRMFHLTTLPAIKKQFGSQVSVEFVHFPLPMHRFAVSAARGAACAGYQGRFSQFVEETFNGQDSIGLKPWSEYAAASGVRDTIRFTRCQKSAASAVPIDSGRAIALRLGLHATPTLVVNGWLVGNDQQEVARVIGELLKKRAPYPDIDSAKVRRIGVNPT